MPPESDTASIRKVGIGFSFSCGVESSTLWDKNGSQQPPGETSVFIYPGSPWASKTNETSELSLNMEVRSPVPSLKMFHENTGDVWSAEAYIFLL